MVKELRPVQETTADYEEIEKRIKAAFRRLLYFPILRELRTSRTRLMNSSDDGLSALTEAIRAQRVTYDGGVFRGRFSAETTRELRAIGATWDRKFKVFRLERRRVPDNLKSVIAAQELEFVKTLKAIDRRLSQILPVEILEDLKFSDLFDKTLWKTDKKLRKTLEGITVAPEMSAEVRRRIAEEWQSNMELSIKTFTEKEISRLRVKVQKSTFAGVRYESIVKTIQQSYGVTEKKAKFLARQETNLVMTKFKESRYTEAGVIYYRWKTVIGSPLHPVRESHKKLDGKVFRWDDPPVTSGDGEKQRRNNPHSDYNCRCQAIPLVGYIPKGKR